MPKVLRLPADRGEPMTISLDGEQIVAYPGETVATALLAAGVNGFGYTRTGDPRMPLCNMGTCFDCVVTVDGAPLTRACLTPVRPEMVIARTRGV